MKKSLLMFFSVMVGCLFLGGCNTTPETAATNSNSEVAASRPGPDDSEISTTTDANGVKTETRVFRNNGHVSKVVVTTKNGVRTTRVYSRSGEEKELSDSDSQNVLEKTGDAIASAAGFVADKTVQGAEKGVDVGKTAAEKTKDAAEKVGDKTAEGAKTVSAKTVEGAKTVSEKTAAGAKKTGKAIKNAIKP